MQQDDPDATVVVRRGGRARDAVKPAATVHAPRAPRRRRRGLLLPVLIGLVALGASINVAVLLVPGKPPPAPPTPVVVAPPPQQGPAPVEELARKGEADILAGRADSLTVVRFAPNPHVVVFDFPSLTEQGLMFNRIAAFVEKRGLPHDRVLNDAELDQALRDDNSTVETYYYGHDYRVSDIARFFAAADRQHQALAPEEEDLRRILTRTGLLEPGVNAAVISIPREGLDPFVDASGRFSLLRHELSHGEYFTNPEYAAFVQRFWRDDLTEADRAAFSAFLDHQGYDKADEDLIANETQAHLMHTTDARYFNARAAMIAPERLAALRDLFRRKMPAGWLRDDVMATPNLP